MDGDQIFSILNKSNDIADPGYGHITVEQTMAIWNLYLPTLSNLSGLPVDRIQIKVSKPSPVKDTYDLVDQLNQSENASHTSIRLYVGE